MANIVLKDKNGASVVYKNIDYLSLQTLEGGTVRFNERATPVITVLELPVEDIDDNAIYRVVTRDEDNTTHVQFYAHEESGEWIDLTREIQLNDITITENGEYIPTNSEDGYAKVVVSVDTFTDVEELPTENIDEEAVYRTTRVDDKTGKTYVTYGVLDTKNTKSFVEYDEEEGWVEKGGGGGDVLPATFTRNGVYDPSEGRSSSLNSFSPGSRYIYKPTLSKQVLAEIYEYIKDYQGVISIVSVDGEEFITGIAKIDEEYLLINDFSEESGQFYATADLEFNGVLYPQGWSTSFDLTGSGNNNLQKISGKCVVYDSPKSTSE
jgi:hypothetical protein